MRVFVNGDPIELAPGMTVRHAVLRAGITAEQMRSVRIFDEWDNEVGLSGGLAEGDRLWIRSMPQGSPAGSDQR